MFVLRDDLIHPIASGNKLRKLKYNVLQARIENCCGLISYGGPYSNHLLACASLSYELNIPVLLNVRGEELNARSNGVLSKCKELGAQLNFISRAEYQTSKRRSGKVEVSGESYWSIPEGGANDLGLKGCSEMSIGLENFKNIIISVGTATTLMGLLSNLDQEATVYYSPIVNQWNMKGHLNDYFNFQGNTSNLIQINDSQGKKFGKMSPLLIQFVEEFNKVNEMQLDPLYTGKTVFNFYQNFHKPGLCSFEDCVFIHTGGINQKFW